MLCLTLRESSKTGWDGRENLDIRLIAVPQEKALEYASNGLSNVRVGEVVSARIKCLGFILFVRLDVPAATLVPGDVTPSKGMRVLAR